LFTIKPIFPVFESSPTTKYPMFILHRFPPFCKRYFKRVRKLIGSCHFSYFWRAVLSISSLSGKKSLSQFRKHSGAKRTRQAISHFLTKAQWDAPDILLDTALNTLRTLGWKSGDTLYLVIDDTQKAKRAKQMDAVSKIYLHAEKRYANRHTIVGAAFVYRNTVVPCAVRLWASRDYCDKSKNNNPHEQREFKTLTELAAECIHSVRLPSQGKAIVLFDKFYLCDTVVKACQTKGYHYIGAVKSNRNFYPDGRPNDKKKLSGYGQKVLAREGKFTTIKDSKKKHRLAEKAGEMKKLGRVKLALSRRAGEQSWIIVATDHLRWFLFFPVLIFLWLGCSLSVVLVVFPRSLKVRL
jgi:SRSO17 transposase